MTGKTVSLRQLNRTTLARQMLLERAPLAIPAAVERLGGLQAQVNNPPYIGLWSRLAGFERDALSALMAENAVVRAPLHRSTLHLVTARDYLWMRPLFQPALNRGLSSFFGRDLAGLALEPVAERARELIAAAPRTMTELGTLLQEVAPERDVAALAYVARTLLPLVQVYPFAAWGKGGSPVYASADQTLGALETGGDLRPLITRYLAAFGPATLKDLQVWTGMTSLKAAWDAIAHDVRVYTDPHGRQLFDLYECALADEDTPAPVVFVPEYDNLMIAHDDRTRVLPDVYRKLVFLSAGRVLATILVDGFVAGVWKVERVKRTTTLVITPFAPLDAPVRDALVAEGERLVRWIDDAAESVAVRFADGA